MRASHCPAALPGLGALGWAREGCSVVIPDIDRRGGAETIGLIEDGGFPAS